MLTCAVMQILCAAGDRAKIAVRVLVFVVAPIPWRPACMPRRRDLSTPSLRGALEDPSLLGPGERDGGEIRGHMRANSAFCLCRARGDVTGSRSVAT